MPATFVEIGLKLLLVFGSQVSMWLGPPSSQNRMTAFAFADGRVSPRAAAEVLAQSQAKKAE